MFFYYYHITSFENFRRKEIILFISVVIKENVNDALPRETVRLQPS